MRFVRVERDGYGAAKPCLCLRRARIREALRVVPSRFGSSRLARLKPRPDLHHLQPQVIALVKQQPDASYLFSGRNGTGKTHFGWALYRHALARGRRVVACSVQELLREFREFELSGGEGEGKARVLGDFKPRVVPSDLRDKKGRRWTLFFDEFEKARPSEFAAEQLFHLLDAAFQFEHQLIVTTNFTDAELVDHWGRMDRVYGTSIVRRLEDCMKVNLF